MGQEVRSPFPGLIVFLRNSLRKLRRSMPKKSFWRNTVHLVFFEFTEAAKTIDKRKITGEVAFVPEFADADTTTPQSVEITKEFMSGVVILAGLGMAVGVEIRQKGSREPWLPNGAQLHVLIWIWSSSGKNAIQISWFKRCLPCPFIANQQVYLG